MTRKTHSLQKFSLLQIILITLGKPFFKIISYLLSALISLSSLHKHFLKRSQKSQPKQKKYVQNKRQEPIIHISKLQKVIFLSIPFFVLLSVGYLAYRYADAFLKALPDVATLPTYKNDASTKVYDRSGKVLYKFYDEINRTPVSLTEVPLSLRQATIAKEDKDFYVHQGISYASIVRAVNDWIHGKKLVGASTITQQLAKNVYLSPERTFTRKIKELVLALQIEKKFSKDQILEFYLNRIPYGGTAYGIQEASRTYFGKDVSQLTLSESAFLASRPQSPSTTFTDAQKANNSKNTILGLMKNLHYITDSEELQASEQTLAFKQERLFTQAPHFVMYAGDLLQKQFGQTVLTGGYSVRTTLDTKIQTLAEAAVEKELKSLANIHVTNAGVVVLSVKTGEILAMVGSRNYNDIEHDGNVNTVLSLRQPGSSIKLVNYAYALSHGFTPASIVDDTPQTFPQKGGPVYKPVNYDGTYKGRMTIRSAFAQSRNLPAVKLLANYGVQNMISLGQRMGITTWTDTNRFGLSLTLGGGEVTLLDLAHVYLTVANYGKRIPLYAFKNLNDQRQDIAPTCVHETCQTEQVLSPEVSYQIVSILSDNAARAGSFGLNSALVIPGHPEVAVKTGTSNSLRDNLAVGFNQNYLVAVWVGNNDGSPMSRVASGVTGASPIWNTIMTALTKDTPSLPWPVPGELVQGKTCDGKLEWFVKGTEPNARCGSKMNDQMATIH